MSILADGMQSYLEVFEYYFGKFGSNVIQPIVWIEFTLTIVIGFIIRGYLFVRFELDKVNKQDVEAKRSVLIYCLSHTGYEFLIGYVICYCLINFTNANPKAFIVNTFICPATGFIIGMVFDNKIIMKLETSNNVANLSRDLIGEDNKKEPPVVIENEPEDNDGVLDKININKFEGCDAQLTCKIVNTINEIIDSHEENNNELVQLSDKLTMMENTIDILKQAEIDDKKLEIKSLIYQCLNEGYAKPAEDAVITNKYNSYMLLIDNKDLELKSLFENRYLKLGVHEDRRRNRVEVENDRRTSNRKLIRFGEYDNETPQE